MKVKKYTASSLPEAMKLVKADLGNGAVILNTREVQKGGFLGLFTKTIIEVFAALDQEFADSKKIEATKPIIQKTVQPPENQTELTKEIRQLKQMVQTLSVQTKQEKSYVPFLQEWHTYFTSQEIESSIVEEILDMMQAKWEAFDEEEQKNYDWKQWMASWFSSRLLVSGFGGFNYETKFLNLVGPTGVGKTTTLAKIAAKAVLKDGKKTAFITTDTYRIAAIDQLRTYAEILNIPIEVAYTAEDFKKAKEKFEQFDLVLVDSAGRNFLNRFYVEELQRVIQFSKDMQNYLVLSLASKYKDMEAIYEQFKHLPVHKVIFTKKDETNAYGSMFNLAIAHRANIAYVTNGQNVPDDIMEAKADQIIRLLLEGKKDD